MNELPSNGNPLHKKALRLIGEAFLILVITAVLLEISARALACWKSNCVLPPSSFYLNTRRDLIPDPFFQNSPPAPDPFFGFVQRQPGNNNVGLPSAVDYPYQKKKDEYVIGLFGGSLALHVFYPISSPEMQKEFDRVPWLKNRKVVWLNFSQGCMRQPQQFILSAFYGETLDLSVSLDGFNEIAMHNPGAPPTEPCFYRELFTDPSRTEKNTAAVKRLKWWQAQAADTMAKYPALTNSAAFHLAWKALHNWAERRIHEIRRAIPMPTTGPEPDSPEEDQALASHWEKFTRLQSSLASRIGLPSVFFLQPNQHLKGTKPLAPEELALWENIPGIRERQARIQRRYESLRKSSGQLQAQGVQTIDLTGIFIRNEEPLYSDDCCHLNDQGRILLAKSMVRQIVDRMLAQKIRAPKISVSGEKGGSSREQTNK